MTLTRVLLLLLAVLLGIGTFVLQQGAALTENDTDHPNHSDITTLEVAPRRTPERLVSGEGKSDDGESNASPLLATTSDVVSDSLEPWLDEYRKTQTVGDSITQYAFASIDDELLTNIRYGNESTFRFRVNDKFDYEITADLVHEFQGGWILSGFIGGKKDMSEASIVVYEDGTKGGDVFVMGIGRLTIVPTPQLPIHLIYLKTGGYDID